MKNKLLSIAICTMLSIASISHADEYDDYDHMVELAYAAGMDRPESDARLIWETFHENEAIAEMSAASGVYGLYYDVEDSDDTGSINMIGGSRDALPRDWNMIYYMSRYDDTNLSVMAVNNHDGTVTMYDPGMAPF